MHRMHLQTLDQFFSHQWPGLGLFNNEHYMHHMHQATHPTKTKTKTKTKSNSNSKPADHQLYFRRSSYGPTREASTTTTAPAYHVREESGFYELEVDLPGVASESRIKLDVTQAPATGTNNHRARVLTLTADRLTAEPTSSITYARSWELADDVADPTSFEASLDNGVLRLIAPKRQESPAPPPTTITVTSRTRSAAPAEITTASALVADAKPTTTSSTAASSTATAAEPESHRVAALAAEPTTAPWPGLDEAKAALEQLKAELAPTAKLIPLAAAAVTAATVNTTTTTTTSKPKPAPLSTDTIGENNLEMVVDVEPPSAAEAAEAAAATEKAETDDGAVEFLDDSPEESSRAASASHPGQPI